jgi:tRNA dimethylallyltransferase
MEKPKWRNGRRTALKMLRDLSHEGSTPSFGTILPMDDMKKILVIVGPTASGKSDLAVKLALEFNDEIVSADSRQIYRGLNIASGKITESEMRGIPHYCLDIADPKERFTIIDWKKEAEKAIVNIHSRGKLPIVCGGTGFYISALIDNLEFPDVPADPEEQKRLELKSAEELFGELKILDPARAEVLANNSGSKNKRRLSRAIIIARALGKDAKVRLSLAKVGPSLIIGLILLDAELKERIRLRTIDRIDHGMIEEAKQLHSAGLPFERMREIGLEYKYLADFLEEKITKEQLIETIITKDWQYARRQKTWWKKDERIVWYSPNDFEKIKSAVHKFLN